MYLNKAFVNALSAINKASGRQPYCYCSRFVLLGQGEDKGLFYSLMLLKRSKRKSILVVRLKSLSYAILK